MPSQFKLWFARTSGNDGRDLSNVLRVWQIFFIALTAVIGTGAFNDFARASATVGPIGCLVAIVLIGLVAACFMEALSELLQIFRTVNPLVEYVQVFVDPALAKCVAGVYWFSYASFMAVQFVTASKYVHEMPAIGRAPIFFIICPVAFTGLNLIPVQWYAWLETLLGALKLVLMLGVTMILFFISGHVHGVSDQKQASTSGIIGSAKVSSNPWSYQGSQTFPAYCTVLLNIAFAFLGVESIAVMSYEAKNKFALKNSSQIIAWVPLVFYLLYAAAINMCFDWTSPTLGLEIDSFSSQPLHGSQSWNGTSAVLVAAGKLQMNSNAVLQNTPLVKSVKAILIICALSAANTTLYISSRTLYGSAKNAHQRNILKRLTKVSKDHVPTTAVIFSAVAFCLWVPFTSLAENATSEELIEFFGFTGSIGVLFVWGANCLAYLRYHYWLRLTQIHLTQQTELRKYNRWDRRESQFFTPTAYFRLQPWTTVLGFLGCVFLVFICPYAVWWQTQSKAKLISVCLFHILVLGSWLVMKLWQMRKPSGDQPFNWWVKIDGGQEGLRHALRTFKLLEMETGERAPERELHQLVNGHILNHVGSQSRPGDMLTPA